jgi:hypothetical protein
MRTILAATVSVMDTAFWWRSECNGHVQSSDRQVTLHPVTDRPANHAPRMQIEDHDKIQPAFARPDIGDVTCPFLVWLICNEVSVQQFGRNVELMVAVRRHLVFAGSDH